MSTSLFFSQLKTFCYEAEQDAKKLRKQVDQKGEAEIVDYSYLDDMNREVLQLQGQLQQLEVKAFNTSSKDEQFSMITVDEVHSQCQTLFEVNQQMITAMETHLQRFGFKPVPKLAKGFIKTVHPGSNGEKVMTGMNCQGTDKENIQENQMNLSSESGFKSPNRLDTSSNTLTQATCTPGEFESPVNVGLFRESVNNQEGSKTPVLSEWKFSSSTKHLLTQSNVNAKQDKHSDNDIEQDTVTKDLSVMDLSYNESPTTSVSPQHKSQHVQQNSGRPSVASSDSSLDLSPSHLDMSYDWSARGMTIQSTSRTVSGSSQNSTADIPLTPADRTEVADECNSPNNMSGTVSSPLTPRLDGALKTVRVKEPLISSNLFSSSSSAVISVTSPQDQIYSSEFDCESPEVTKKKNISISKECQEADCDYNSDCSDPSTPELPELSISIAKYKVPFHRSAAKSASKNKTKQEGVEKSEGDTAVGKLQYPEDDCGSSDGECSDNEMDIGEIETSTRLLQPRRTAGGGAGADGSGGWVPLVSADEWRSVPSFLKMQVSVETLNVALDRINKNIEEVNARGVRKGHLESFSVTEIEDVVGGNHVDKTPVKTIILGLVHLKRLDICNENSIKVYKVRRFY